MHIAHTYRNRLLAVALFAIVFALPLPAGAASKEIIELQTQVQQLLDMVQRIQSTLDTRFGVLQNLAQQTADNATQMTATVNALQQKINAQSEAASTKRCPDRSTMISFPPSRVTSSIRAKPSGTFV